MFYNLNTFHFLFSKKMWVFRVGHFPIGILGQVWYLIVSIPALCTLTYFGIHKILFRIANRDDPGQTASAEVGLLCSSRPF